MGRCFFLFGAGSFCSLRSQDTYGVTRGFVHTGELAFLLFALGLIGTGFLSVPVLAGSAAYAIGEAAHWKVGLSRKPAEARGFYGAITAATFVGMAINILNVSPIAALYWSAVINGVVAVP